MKFPFDISEIIFKPITLITGNDIPNNQRRLDKLCIIVDELGYASAAAQNLRTPITSLAKLKAHPDQRLYIMREENQRLKVETTEISSRDDLHMFHSGGLSGYKDLKNDKKFSVVGMIKVGVKTLYVVDELNRQIEIIPLCVLDFYIDDNLQKKGYGRRLFEYMLEMEVISPQHLAYDRPSVKFLSFLKKYYNLHQFIPQANNFVIFKEYGLQNLDLDHRGRPKTSIKYLTQNQTLRPVNLRRKDEFSEEGLIAKKYKQIFENPENHKNQDDNLYPYSFFLLKSHSVIPPIDNANRADSNVIATPSPSLPEHEIKPEIIESQPPKQEFLLNETENENQSQDKVKQQLMDNDTDNLQRLYTNDFSLREPKPINSSAKDLQSIHPSIKVEGPFRPSSRDSGAIQFTVKSLPDPSPHITTGTTISVSKPLVYQHEVERQNRISTLVAETHLQSRIPAVPIFLEPLKAHIRPAGIRSDIESRKRNFHYRYNNRSKLAGLKST